jgi:hypothetical protein
LGDWSTLGNILAGNMDLLLKDAPKKEDSPVDDIADKDMNQLMTKIKHQKKMTPQELERQRLKLRENR